MSYRALDDLLQGIFSNVNSSNAVPTPQEVWNSYGSEIDQLLNHGNGISSHFTQLDDSITTPRAVEAARLLQSLKQRFRPDGNEKTLVGRIRADTVLRKRPRRNVSRSSLTGEAREISSITPETFSAFSRFQTEGWSRVSSAIESRDEAVIVAPTGAGKTEVFLLPIIYRIVRALRNGEEPPRFIFLYPRNTLLRDQLGRILRYVHHATQNILRDGQQSFSNHIPAPIVGFQFGGVRANYEETLANRDIFGEDETFKLVDTCPVCEQGVLRGRSAARRNDNGVVVLRCSNSSCNVPIRTSIAKNDHAKARPHILVTTVESIDLLYLKATRQIDNYLRSIDGIVFDEAHLYHSIYGAHVSNIVRRLENLRSNGGLAKIASSATISSPETFAGKLFHGDNNRPVLLHDASDYEQEPVGLEVLYFIQSPDEDQRPGANNTLIQSVMAMGHGVLDGDDRALIFTESLDMVGRFHAQIRDAEETKELWRFRVNVPEIYFRGARCPGTNPAACTDVYHHGECWRGLLGGEWCCDSISGLRAQPLSVEQVSSRQRSGYWRGNVVVATSAMEVGVDDDRIKATVHYLPPRTIFSFIQRRGRAGRSSGDTATTLMVLGNTPSDHFYFFRRNRLVHGTYDLPLNPNNLIVRQMHDRLERERNLLSQRISECGGQQKGIWRWVWEKLYGCSFLRSQYRDQLLHLDRYPSNQEQQDLRRDLRNWISREKEVIGNYLSIRWTLRNIANESPSELNQITSDALTAVESYLSGESQTVDEVGTLLRRLYTNVSELTFDEEDQAVGDQLVQLRDKVMSVWQTLRQHQGSVELQHAERLYDFFRTLERLCEEQYVLNFAPETLRVVLQALFYLHLGLEEHDDSGCQSRVTRFIPNSYFQEVDPLVVEARRGASSSSSNDFAELHQENVTDLASSLVPHNPIYRYHGEYLSVLDVEPDLSSVNQTQQTVTVSLQGEGVRRSEHFMPQKVATRPLKTDDQGRQLIKICPECFNLYSINRRRPCHNSNLLAVRLHTEPMIERAYSAGHQTSITRTLGLSEEMYGTTTVLGSYIKARKAVWNAQSRDYVPMRGSGGSFGFSVLYDLPVRYSISTKGIVWNLTDVLPTLMEDEDLRHLVESVTVSNEPKRFDEELVLHTAAHMLHKAIASISGVNEQMLEYSYRLESEEVVVWERYEGGAGVSETFTEALKRDPVEVFQELLATILCPVDLAESNQWSAREDLLQSLAAKWHLSSDSEFLSRIVKEAEAERRAQQTQQDEETKLLCKPPEGNDGCPACIHATNCTHRHEQETSVSRAVAEAVLLQLVRTVERETAESLTAESIERSIATPAVLSVASERETHALLLL